VLVAEVAAFRLDPGRPLADTGSLNSDLVLWGRELAAHFGSPHNASLLRAGAALADRDDRDCTAGRRAEARVLADRAAARGEITPTVDQIVDHIVAPITYRAIFAPRPLTPEEVDGLVRDLLREG